MREAARREPAERERDAARAQLEATKDTLEDLTISDERAAEIGAKAKPDRTLREALELAAHTASAAPATSRMPVVQRLATQSIALAMHTRLKTSVAARPVGTPASRCSSANARPPHQRDRVHAHASSSSVSPE